MITVHCAQQNLHHCQKSTRVDIIDWLDFTFARSIRSIDSTWVDSVDRLDLSRLCRSTRLESTLSIDSTWVDSVDRLDVSAYRSTWSIDSIDFKVYGTSLQTDNHASTPPLSFYGPDALPAAQPTVSKHWQLTLKMNGCSDDLGKYTVFWITNHWLMFVPKMITIKQCLLKLQLKMLGIFFEIPCIEKSAAVWQCIPNNSSILEDFRITLISPYCT